MENNFSEIHALSSIKNCNLKKFIYSKLNSVSQKIKHLQYKKIMYENPLNSFKVS